MPVDQNGLMQAQLSGRSDIERADHDRLGPIVQHVQLGAEPKVTPYGAYLNPPGSAVAPKLLLPSRYWILALMVNSKPARQINSLGYRADMLSQVMRTPLRSIHSTTGAQTISRWSAAEDPISTLSRPRAVSGFHHSSRRVAILISLALNRAERPVCAWI